jgi:DNA polymerase III gamma/tau subunit
MLNLPQELTPLRWEEFWGHDMELRQLLNCISNGVTTMPRSITIYGSTGSGKTSLINLLIRSLNCSNPQDYTRNGITYRGVNPCGECELCRQVIDFRQQGSEYTNILHLQPGAYGTEEESTGKLVKRGLEFGSKPPVDLGYGRPYFRFVIFDEWQLFPSNERQKVLLKAELENDQLTVYIMLTMQPEKIPEQELWAIEERGFPIELRNIPDETIKDYLLTIAPNSGYPLLTEEIAAQIARASHGSIRAACCKYQQLGVHDPYCDYIQPETVKYFLRYTDAEDRIDIWKALQRGKYYEVEELIQRIMSVYGPRNVKDFVLDLTKDIGNAMRERRGNHDHQLFALRRLYESIDLQYRVDLKDYLLQLGGLDLGVT